MYNFTARSGSKPCNALTVVDNAATIKMKTKQTKNQQQQLIKDLTHIILSIFVFRILFKHLF